MSKYKYFYKVFRQNISQIAYKGLLAFYQKKKYNLINRGGKILYINMCDF